MQHLTSGTTLQNGKYKIERVLGQGGFGITYLATDTTTNAYVAIKELFVKELSSRDEETLCITSSGSSDLMTNIRRKFLKESQMLKQLRHPNIVRVYDSFEENGTAYYVMEYIQGISLDEHLKTKGVLSERAAIATIKKVAKAVEYLHGRSINHLDIKPANILLRKNSHKVILIDFGTSKHYDATTGNQTSATPIGVSEGYAPLEQYRQGGVGEFSPEADIYALGATLFKLLTGTTPPSAADVVEYGVPVSDLKAKGISSTCISAICSAMRGRKSERIHRIGGFIRALDDDGNTIPLDEGKEHTNNKEIAYDIYNKLLIEYGFSTSWYLMTLAILLILTCAVIVCAFGFDITALIIFGALAVAPCAFFAAYLSGKRNRKRRIKAIEAYIREHSNTEVNQILYEKIIQLKDESNPYG